MPYLRLETGFMCSFRSGIPQVEADIDTAPGLVAQGSLKKANLLWKKILLEIPQGIPQRGEKQEPANNKITEKNYIC